MHNESIKCETNQKDSQSFLGNHVAKLFQFRCGSSKNFGNLSDNKFSGKKNFFLVAPLVRGQALGSEKGAFPPLIGGCFFR